MEFEQPLLSDMQDVEDVKNVKDSVTKDQESVSAPPPSYETRHDSPFALISFHTLDRIRLTRLPESHVTRIRDCVVANWTPGIQHCQPYGESMELKVKDFLFGGSHVGNPKVTKLIQAVMAELYNLGWSVEQSTILCKKADQKDTLLLRRTCHSERSASWFSISFDQQNVLTVHTGPTDICQNLMTRFQAQDWSAETAYVEDRIEIRLKKAYWMAQGEDTVKVRLMLLEIAEVLDLSGFRIYASARLCNWNDILFCMKENHDALV